MITKLVWRITKRLIRYLAGFPASYLPDECNKFMDVLIEDDTGFILDLWMPRGG